MPDLCIPTLMYHSVAPQSGDYLTVAQDQFDRQIAHLTAHYAVVRVRDALGALDGAQELPPDPVLITFDDALMDNIVYAEPVLARYHASAVFFAIAGYLGQTNAWNTRAYQFADHMRPADLAALVTAGYEIGSHTMTHHRMTKLSDEQLEEEFTRAHAILTAAAGVVPAAFAYPYGHADERCWRACARHYRLGFASSRQGETDWRANPVNIRRIYIAPDDTPETLDQKIKAYRAAGADHP